MSIASRKDNITHTDSAVDRAIRRFTVPWPNCDGSKTSALEDVLGYQAQSRQTRHAGGRPEGTNSIKYTLLAAWVAFALLVTTNRAVSEASACRLLLTELTADQRRRLGMTADLAGTRYDEIAAGLAEGATPAAIRASQEALILEYARFAKFYTNAMRVVDPSPFAKGKKLLNRERQAILADLTHPLRRVDPATSDRHFERLQTLANKILASSAAEAPTDGWNGDIVTDETIVITTAMRPEHGTAADKLRSVDPDAEYWPGKKDATPAEIGFGYGITFVARVPRPYGRRIPVVAIGMHVGKPTGGTTEAFTSALSFAERFGLTKANRDRICVGDNKYSSSNTWIATLIERGYQWVTDYPSTWDRTKSLADVARDGKTPANGPVLVRGPLLCPGAAGLTSEQLPTKQGAVKSAPPAIVRHRATVRFLEALAMPIVKALSPAKADRRGRPRKDEPRSTSFTGTFQCPAGAGKVNCVNYQCVDGLRDPRLPDVPNPPHPDPAEAHLRPRACQQNYTTYRFDVTEAKWLQPLFWGSHIHTDTYGSMRSANERMHSPFKSNCGSGVTGENWVQVRGIAKVATLLAIAAANNNDNQVFAFHSKHEAEAPTDAELRRRDRERVLAAHRKLAA